MKYPVQAQIINEEIKNWKLSREFYIKKNRKEQVVTITTLLKHETAR